MFFFISIFASFILNANKNPDYLNYHSQITEAEALIRDEKFSAALTKYEEVFSLYNFVFLRDYLVAALRTEGN
ncbi:MAG: hypothetical protein JSV59_04115 [Flavobacteriaceae bacterium]|nr:MAG: hypothetical protein JSV59_11575 [Flavobacteriaceae bacterium]UCD61761.1 MAG: hypothetical protein JSV59_04115 [Flavobacteriaceae bacterium]